MHTIEFLGSLGLGAGLMYLLDPDTGDGRRDHVRGYVGNAGRQTGDFVDDTGRTLGRQAQAVLATTRRPFRRQPGLSERLLAQAEQFGTTTGMVLVGCVGLGVGLGYWWARQGPTQPRHASQQERSQRWRFFQGHDTWRVDAHTRKPAQAEAWYVEPRAYDSGVLYSEPFVTRDEAEAWAEAQDKS